MSCQFLDKCPFFAQFKANDAVCRGFVSLYCSDLSKSERCERKKYRLTKGTPPPPNMTPTGKLV